MADTGLSRIDDTSIEDLRDVAQGIKSYVKTENDAALQAALERMQQRPGLFSRLFPTAIDKEQTRSLLDRMRAVDESRAQLFKVYSEVQLEIARKQGDALIASVGMKLQTALTAFAQENIDQLTTTIEVGRERFMERLYPIRKNLERFKDDPELYEHGRRSTQKEMEIYFDTVEKLLNGFVDALSRKVTGSSK